MPARASVDINDIPRNVSSLATLKTKSWDRWGDCKLKEDGVWLRIEFRSRGQVDDFTALVRDAGGSMLEVKRGRRGERYTPWVVVFSVSLDADLYLCGQLPMREIADLPPPGRRMAQ